MSLFHAFGGLTAVMKMWMFYEALWMRRDPLWAAVVMVVPFGEWVYFFHLRGMTIRIPWLKRLLKPEPSLEELEHRCSECPTQENFERFGRALLEKGQSEHAARIFTDLMAKNDDNKRIRQELARALNGCKRHEEAASHFRWLWDHQPSLSLSDVAVDYASVLEALDRQAEAITLLRQVVSKSDRLIYKNALAKMLISSGQTLEARRILEGALKDYRFGSKLFKKIECDNHRESKRLLSKAQA